MADPISSSTETPQHLRQVSRIKHEILQKYLPAWQVILGSTHGRLCYLDCYAGPGVYELDGKLVDGSPIIAVRAATEYLSTRAGKRMTLGLVEQDETQLKSLEMRLKTVQPYPENLAVQVAHEDAADFVPTLLSGVQDLAPTFFMIDPYGHALTIPIINEILRREQTEALINFMFYRINMDIANVLMHGNVDRMFGHRDWRDQDFMRLSGAERDRALLQYYLSQIKCKYKFHFRIQFGVDEQANVGRTKYYLIHASNHPKAVLLMKEVMWALGDDEGLFDYSGYRGGRLFSISPTPEELRKALLETFAGRELGFDKIREESWELPFIERNYRTVLKALKAEGVVSITPVTSKTAAGLSKKDRIRFP